MTSATESLPAGLQVFERGWLSANTLLFTGRAQTAVVDTGYATHAMQTVALIDAALGPRPLDLLLNTHLHSDHCGGNAALQSRYPGVRTLIPPGEAAAVEAWDEEALSFKATGQRCDRFRFDGLLAPGSEIVLADLPWQVHAAKGHDPHSVILFEPVSRTLISADALWENGFGVVFPELFGEPSFDEVGATLDLIESLAPSHVVPGHGRVLHDAPAALRKARSRLEGFQRQPVKHARHALKVLLKFKLLEWQSISREEWAAWLAATPYVETVRARFFHTSPLDDLAGEILDELVAVGAAATDGARIFNR
ncbi:MBL fold metallo-hydrolase [Variovorax sp. J31P179]|uniref:MBL fold metallo-hydrolase n=1 Tax=Variovorax sp. J31P179 TaxID=3053508 RepID=UPI0025762320|nr:MBL fold metallo-hydrolase [Variovorax sp. J31P179]MDM0082632.1 MBL fold metallo-hydrolase [Variovorax sp. J31P179]